MSVTFTLDDDRVGWIVFDAPGSRANIFDEATQLALSDALAASVVSGARALVVAGAKERIFIAGADLHRLRELRHRDAAEAYARRGQELFQRIADSQVPVVCAIHGACAGGGFELALACDWRMASTAAETQVGLPETSLGTIPGWGGCVRLSRLLGAEKALEHILRGQLLSGTEALRAGFVDELAHPHELRERARRAALSLVELGRPRRTDPTATGAAVFASLRRNVEARTQGRQPAPLAAIAVVEESTGRPVREALAIEARHFGDVTAGPVFHAMLHAFFLREAARKRTLQGWRDVPEAINARPVRKVGVVGAGVMGSGIAHWLATRGFDVVLRDVRPEFIERAAGVIRGLLEESMQRGRCTADEAALAFNRIRTTPSWDGFAECDVVIEAIVEDVDAKRALFSELAGRVSPDALLASNTSALPIEDIAGHVAHPGRTLGLHFFNPVSRMPLVELVLSRDTTPATARRALDLVRSLGKSPLICRSSPGFLVTRVLFFYLNAAVRRWESGADAATIDRALRDFGWPMGPLRLIDEVGVDVTAFIFGEMARYFPGRFLPSSACGALVGGGCMGRKNGAGRGFYRYDGGRDSLNDDEARRLSGTARKDGIEPGDIAAELMAVMLEESRQCLAEKVVLSPEDVDFALLAGAGFPVFRGGLLYSADARRRT